MSTPRFKFTGRDSELLTDLFKHRYLTISQIKRLYFPSLQTAYRRMRILREHGYVLAFTVPNIEEAIFGLTSKGLQTVAELLGVARADLRTGSTKGKPADYYFMRHFAAVNDFRIALRQSCQGTPVRLLGFIPDYLGQRKPDGSVTKYIRDITCDIGSDRAELSHTPDGVFALERGDKRALFFLEIDRGSEVVSDPSKGVAKAIRFYANYLTSGGYQRYAKEFGIDQFKGFRALFVTPNADRIETIRKAAAGLTILDKAKRFVWITTSQQVERDGLLNPIWKSAHREDSASYSLLGRNSEEHV